MKEALEDTADLIDSEPILFLGCSSGEILTLSGLGFMVGLVIGLIIAIITGIGLLALPFLILLPIVAIYYGGQRLGKAKEGKPSGYYDRLISIKLNALGLGNSFVIRTGHWRNRR